MRGATGPILTDDEQRASASSGSRARNERVTLVSRVPNRNTETRLRASVMAWRKCRNRRVYSLIDPEISSSATIGAGLSIRPSLRISMISPPVAQGGAQRPAHVEPQSPHIRLVTSRAQLGLRQPHIGDRARHFGDLGRAHLRKILLLQYLLVGDRQPQLLLLGLRGLLAHRGLRQSLLHPARGRRRFFSWRDPANGTESSMCFQSSAARKKQVEGLGKDQRMLVTLDEDGFQRGVDVSAVADLDHLQRIQGVDDRTRPNRNAGGAQRTGKADDVVGHLAGGRVEVVDRGHWTNSLTEGGAPPLPWGEGWGEGFGSIVSP